MATKIKAGLKFRLEADVEDYKQMLSDGWAGSMDGLVEQIEGDTVFVRLVDGQAWRFGLKQFEEVTTPHDWQGEISDIGLPDGDGWELLAKAHLPATVYAVAMSGFGMNSDRLKSKAAGFRRHLLKPFVPKELDAALEEAAREAAVRK